MEKYLCYFPAFLFQWILWLTIITLSLHQHPFSETSLLLKDLAAVVFCRWLSFPSLVIAKIPTEPDNLKELEKVRTVGLRIVIFWESRSQAFLIPLPSLLLGALLCDHWFWFRNWKRKAPLYLGFKNLNPQPCCWAFQVAACKEWFLWRWHWLVAPCQSAFGTPSSFFNEYIWLLSVGVHLQA